MSEWKLADCIDPVERMEDTPIIPISSESQFRGILDQLQQRRPGLVILEGPNQEFLHIFIGGPFAGLRWMKLPGSNHCKHTVAGVPLSPGGVEFSEEGVDNLFNPEQLLPVEDVIEAAVYFFNNQRLPDWITWKAWNPVTKEWDLSKPSPRNGSQPALPAELLSPVPDRAQARG